jgi:hypothetical protein
VIRRRRRSAGGADAAPPTLEERLREAHDQFSRDGV